MIDQQDLFSEYNEQKQEQINKRELVLSEFTLEWFDLFYQIRMLSSALTGYGKRKYFQKCELFVTERGVLFKMFENEVFFECKTIGETTSEFYFMDLWERIKMLKKNEAVHFTVREGLLGVGKAGNLNAETKRYKEQPPKPLSSLKYEEHEQSSRPSIRFKHKKKDLYFSETEINNDAAITHKWLKKYGVTFQEMELFIKTFLLIQKPL